MSKRKNKSQKRMDKAVLMSKTPDVIDKIKAGVMNTMTIARQLGMTVPDVEYVLENFIAQKQIEVGSALERFFVLNNTMIQNMIEDAAKGMWSNDEDGVPFDAQTGRFILSAMKEQRAWLETYSRVLDRARSQNRDEYDPERLELIEVTMKTSSDLFEEAHAVTHGGEEVGWVEEHMDLTAEDLFNVDQRLEGRLLDAGLEPDEDEDEGEP